MTRTIVVRPQARSELDEQAEYIARDSLDAALRFLDAAEETFREIAESPGLGHPWESPHERLQGVRVWRVKGFKKHLVFYHATEEGIEVLHVLHEARDLPAILEKIEDEP